MYVIYKLVKHLGENLEPEESRESYHQLNFFFGLSLIMGEFQLQPSPRVRFAENLILTELFNLI